MGFKDFFRKKKAPRYSMQALPDSMKFDAVTGTEDKGKLGAYLMHRERENRAKTRQMVDMCRGGFSPVRQSELEARNMIAVGSRYEAGFDAKAYEAEHPEIKAMVDAALEWGNEENRKLREKE